ncbi:MAG: CHASE3 domain-containing protein, partial [Cytophagales bacterium]|nr:CHASE3 domain-containing protein [Cytophagales bacterium]
MFGNVYNRFIIYVFAGFFGMFSVIVGVSFYERGRSEEREAWVNHTHEVISSTERLLSYLKDAETGQRGYLLTQDSAYLKPYTQSIDSISSSLARINFLVRDNAEQRVIIASLGDLIKDRLSVLKSNLGKHPNSDPQFLKDLGEGREKMDQIRVFVHQMLQRENQLLELRIREFNHSKSLTTLLLWAIYVLVFLYSIFTAIYLQKLINNQRVYERELDVKNHELHAFNEEMDALNEELKSANEELLATNEEYLAANEELNEANDMIRFQSEKLIRQSEERLNEVLDSINDIVSSSDATTRQILFVNVACERVLGINQDMVYADSGLIYSMIHPEDREQLQKDRELLFEVGSADSEFRFIRPEGQIVW